MIESESRLPLLIGAVVALLLHAALVPVWGLGIDRMTPVEEVRPPKEDKPLPRPEELNVGRANRSVTNLAWIPYDDFQALLARQEVVEQPAIQRQQDPVPDAPIEMDPTPPLPDSQPNENASPPDERPNETDAASVPVSPVGPVPLPKPEAEGKTPYAPQGPMLRKAPLVVENAAGSPTDATSSSEQPQPDEPGSTTAESKPTSAPRDKGEAQPVTIIPGIIKVRPGEVLTADGIEVKTVIPRPSITARVSTIPKNPTVEVYFNNKGVVTRVEMTRSTGADNWDDPIVSAFEQWTATGERIDSLQGELKMTVNLLINEEP